MQDYPWHPGDGIAAKKLALSRSIGPDWLACLDEIDDTGNLATSLALEVFTQISSNMGRWVFQAAADPTYHRDHEWYLVQPFVPALNQL